MKTRRFSRANSIPDRDVQRAFNQLHYRAKTVVCAQCGRDLKPETNLLMLRLHGCPACLSRKFIYDARPETHYVAPETETAATPG